MAWASEMMLTLTWGEAMCTLSWPPTSSLTVAVNLVLVFITWGGNGIIETVNSTSYHLGRLLLDDEGPGDQTAQQLRHLGA